MTKEEIAEDVVRVNRYHAYHVHRMEEWYYLSSDPDRLEKYDANTEAAEKQFGILEDDSLIAKMTEKEMLELADLHEFESSDTFGKTIYTLLDGKGTSCYYKVGLYHFDRLGIYVGNDLGYPVGTMFS